MKMRTARVLAQSIKLLCPECNHVVTASSGSQTLYRDSVVDRWELMQKKPWECPHCHKSFKLPVNPFREDKLPDA